MSIPRNSTQRCRSGGIVYELDTKSNLIVLHTFTDGADGGFPYEAKADQIMHMDALVHNPENLGEPFEGILIELK